MVKQIPLTQGKFALVDDEDFERVNQYKWHVALGGKATKYYAVRKTGTVKKRITIIMHRFIINAPDGLAVDHINHNTLDNRKENLRVCTYSQNKQNGEKQANNTSGYKGVWWEKGRQRWHANITIDGKTKHIGRFRNIKDAVEAYDSMALEHYGEFAYTNAMAGLL